MKVRNKKRNGRLGIGLGLGLLAVLLFIPHRTIPHPELASVHSHSLSPQLEVVWNHVGAQETLKIWTLPELTALKMTVSREKDPVTGELVDRQGVLLSSVIENALDNLTPDSRAQIDLVILKNELGEQAPIPRFLIARYPFMLALDLKKGAIDSVVPWTSRPLILKENLPLEKYFVPHISHVELTSDQEQYKPLFLKRRTDPSAMRGEKLFIQNCAVCHQLNQESPPQGRLAVRTPIDVEKERAFLSGGHPFINVMLKLSDKDRKSIVRYLDAFRSENPDYSPGGN